MQIEAPVGQQFDRLTVIRELPFSPGMKRPVLVRCVCGMTKPMPLYSVLSGNSRSCGCLRHEQLVAAGAMLMRPKHGIYAAGSPELVCDGCGGSKTVKAAFCRSCRSARARQRRAEAPRRWRDPETGYVYVEHPGRRGQNKVAEHIAVMEADLGRELYRGESVHHRNGVRHDNRLSNLELWVSHQPRGQRPADLVAWAHEILSRYEEPAR